MKLYRFLTGTDDAAFCHRVTDALNKGWSLHGSPALSFNSQTGQPGTEHDATKDIAKIPVQMTPLSAPVERFTISIEPAEGGGVLHLEWDTTRVSAPFKVVGS